MSNKIDKIDRMLNNTKKKMMENDISMYRIAKDLKLSYATVMSVMKGNGTVKNLRAIVNYVQRKAYVYDPMNPRKEFWED